MSKIMSLSSLKFSCWLCGSSELKLVKDSDIVDKERANSQLFAITDTAYGKTFKIYRCIDCGFMQCSEMSEVLPFYEELQDQLYEDTREPRALQMRKILHIIQRYKSRGQLLDVGAGSGILVEQAVSIGYDAQGLEPSKWLYEKAKEHNLPVSNCTLDNFKTNKKYDVVTMIDVIEHVSSPLKLLSDAHKLLNSDGVVVVITPNVNSVMAKIMGWKWWHYRAAHIGYFNKHTLNFAFNKCGFELIAMKNPSWYFCGEYIIDRINKYMPIFYKTFIPTFFKRMIIAVNLQDSMLGIYKLKG